MIKRISAFGNNYLAAFILTLLLLCGSFQSQSQVAMFHAHNQMPAVEYLLDAYPTALVAYSLRKLDADYTGFAIRVRRSSDNAESNIGFVSNIDLDTASLKSFIGSSDAFVTIWYDQSGNGRNGLQTTNSRQSKIAIAGTIIRVNGKPSIEFLGDYGYTAAFTTTSQPISAFSVNKLTGPFTSADVLFDSYTNTQFVNYTNGPLEAGNLYAYRMAAGAGLIGSASATNTNTNLWSSIFNTTSSTMHVNGVSVLSGNTGTNSLTDGISIGQIRQVVVFNYGWSGYISELVLYAANKSSDRTSIESNINSFYTIY